MRLRLWILALLGLSTCSLSRHQVIVNVPGVIQSITPATVTQGDSSDTLTLVGQGTHWTAGTGSPSGLAIGGGGVTISSFTVTDATHATAVVSVALGAATGARAVTVTSGWEVAPLSGATFTVLVQVGTPTNPSPPNAATNVSLTPTLTWSATNATTYDVNFGFQNPPPNVSTGQSAASYVPGTLGPSAMYFWQILAHAGPSSAQGPLWSFTTTSAGCSGTGPTICSTTGTLTNGATLTIAGVNFGTKTTAAPTIWDNCAGVQDGTGASITTLWTGGWPDNSTNPANNLQYRAAPFRNVSAAHQFVHAFMAGSHAENNGFNAGYNVMVFKARVLGAYPQYTFATYWYRVDPLYDYRNPDTAEPENEKLLDWSSGTSPYDFPSSCTGCDNWYVELLHGGAQDVIITPNNFDINDDANPPSGGINGGHIDGLGDAGVDQRTAWSKVEYYVKWTTDNTGTVDIYQNGVHMLTFSGGFTDSIGHIGQYAGGGQRTDAIGGFSRQSGNANNWKYWNDLYLDYSFAHVIIGNASTWAASTVREVQIPTAWSTTSITVTLNQASLSALHGSWLYVMDSAGNVNANGFAL